MLQLLMRSKMQVKEDYYKDEAQKNLAARLEELQKAGAFGAAIKQGIKVEKTGWLKHSSGL